jgi:two-component system chemotaxis response regulator CheY
METVVSKKILIVDDSATIRQQVRTALATASYEIVEAADGNEGLEVMSGRDDLGLVLCDVNMPRMGGLEMLELGRARGVFGALPVVMLTTEGNPTLVQRARAAGAKGWIVKPFKPEFLIATVRKLALT